MRYQFEPEGYRIAQLIHEQVQSFWHITAIQPNILIIGYRARLDLLDYKYSFSTLRYEPDKPEYYMSMLLVMSASPSLVLVSYTPKELLDAKSDP